MAPDPAGRVYKLPDSAPDTAPGCSQAHRREQHRELPIAVLLGFFLGSRTPALRCCFILRWVTCSPGWPHSPGWPQAYCVAKYNLKLLILPLLVPKWYITGMCPHAQLPLSHRPCSPSYLVFWAMGNSKPSATTFAPCSPGVYCRGLKRQEKPRNSSRTAATLEIQILRSHAPPRPQDLISHVRGAANQISKCKKNPRLWKRKRCGPHL